MTAVILAAGRGTRLGPVTADLPKCLVPFRGRTILDRAAASLTAAGVDRIVVVTGYRADLIESRGFETRHNPDFATTNMVHSLFCAGDLFDDELLIVYGDIVFRPEAARAMLASPAPLALGVNTRWQELWARRMSDPLADAETLRMNAHGHVTELGRKPTSLEEIEGQYMGLVKLSREAAPKVRAFYHGLDPARRYEGRELRNMYMTSFLQEIIDRLMPVSAVLIDGGWLEVDSQADLAAYEGLDAAEFE